MMVRKLGANHAGERQSSESDDSGENLARTKLCTPLRARKIEIKLNRATSNINESNNREKKYQNNVSGSSTSKKNSSRLFIAHAPKDRESSCDPVFVTRHQISRNSRRYIQSRSPSCSSDSPTRYKRKYKKKKTSRNRLVTTVDSLSDSSDGYGRCNEVSSKPKIRYSYHSSKKCTRKRKQSVTPEKAPSNTYECPGLKQISMYNMDRLHNRRKNEDTKQERSQTTRSSFAPFQHFQRNQQTLSRNDDLWLEEAEFLIKKVRGRGSVTSNISDSDTTKSSLGNSTYDTPESISRNHYRANSTENSRDSKELMLLTEKVPTHNPNTERQKGLFKSSSLPERQPLPLISYNDTHDDDLGQAESDEYIATTPPSIEELRRVQQKPENLVQSNHLVNSIATTANMLSPVYEREIDPSNKVVSLPEGRDTNISNHSFKERFESEPNNVTVNSHSTTTYMASPVYEKEIDPSNEVVILEEVRETNIKNYSFKEPFESDANNDELFDAYAFVPSGSAHENVRIKDNGTNSPSRGNITHKPFTTQPIPHAPGVPIDYDGKTLKHNVENEFGTKNQEGGWNIVQFNGKKLSNGTPTRLPPLPPVINNTTQHLEFLQHKAKTDTKKLHLREITEIEQTNLHSRKNSLKPKEGISSTAVDLIELSDDDVFIDIPRDPRSNANRKNNISRNGLERVSSNYDLFMANVQNVWCKDLLKVIVNGSSFRPLQFGHVSDYFASQQMLIIPWTSAHYFKYNIDNPCIVDDQSCKHYSTRQCRQCKAEYEGNRKAK